MKKGLFPVISIGIPVYNEAENIRELAESILAQKNFNFSEVIFIVSACTDNSIAVAKQFMEKDARFRLTAYYKYSFCKEAPPFIWTKYRK